MSKEYRQGLFRPKNPTKYKGDPNRIVYRSSWELKLMDYLDRHPDVIEWSSEETIVPYFDPTVQRMRRYFPDFVVKSRTKKGVETRMIEVKPESQVVPPKKRKRRSAKMLAEEHTYVKNLMKWQAAEEYCKKRGWVFQIMTERHIFP